MAKRKGITNLPDVSKQNYELIKAGVKVFPEYMKDPITKKWSWYILYSDNGKVTRYNKPISSNEINLCVHLSIIDRYNKLEKTTPLRTAKK
jgi:hypothetical protein